MDYSTIESNLRAWLPAHPDISAAAVIGSRGRSRSYPADESSDLDLLLVTSTPDAYRHTGWLGDFGPLVSAVFDPHDHVAFAESLDFFAVYTEGCNVDWSLLPAEYLHRLIDDPGARARDFVHLITPTLARGFRVLHDPDGRLDQLAAAFPAEGHAFTPPSETEFVEMVENYWQFVVRVAKKLRADHRFIAFRWRGALRDDLLRLVEWHARLTRDLPPDTWFRDKYLEQWADPRVLAVLPTLACAYDANDIRRALFTQSALFRTLAHEVAARLGYRYPEHVDAAISAWLERYLEV